VTGWRLNKRALLQRSKRTPPSGSIAVEKRQLRSAFQAVFDAAMQRDKCVTRAAREGVVKDLLCVL
jgi:hypothetical protein